MTAPTLTVFAEGRFPTAGPCRGRRAVLCEFPAPRGDSRRGNSRLGSKEAEARREAREPLIERDAGATDLLHHAASSAVQSSSSRRSVACPGNSDSTSDQNRTE